VSLQEHASLIHISLDVVGGRERAQVLLVKTKQYGRIVGISSVYKRYLTSARNDINAKMEFVMRFVSTQSVDQTLQLVLSFCENDCQLVLLAFDSTVIMSPRLTLPYPLLHTDGLIIRCAAEAWAEYAHPVYQKTLSEISKAAPPVVEAEFYLQGKSLVDF